MTERIAVNGQEITEAMIERWCASYERGDFPPGERTVGGIVRGRPPLSSDGTTTLTIKLPVGMKAALAKRARESGKTVSGYARDIIAGELMAPR